MMGNVRLAAAENRWNTPNLRKNDALASAPAHFHYKHTISIPFFAFFSTYKQSTFLLHTPYNKITRVQQFFLPPQNISSSLPFYLSWRHGLVSYIFKKEKKSA